MKDSLLVSTQLVVDASSIDENTTVILGFTGFGSVGTTVLNHICEACDVNSIGFWGGMSWYHRDRLESPLTIYKLNLKSDDPDEKFILISSRIPIPVIGYNALPDAFWKFLSQEILSWKVKRYIVIGGLREDVRSVSDDAWVALIPSPKYQALYKTKRTFKDHLVIKGPINFMLTEGIAFNNSILAILSYCNTYDVDRDAAQIALKELEKHLKLKLESDKLHEFDSSFIEPDPSMFWIEEESSEDFEGYDEDSVDFEEDDDTMQSDEQNGKDGYFSFKTYKDFHSKGDKLDDYK